MVAIFVVILVAAAIVGFVSSGWKASAAWVVFGIFLASSSLGVSVRATLTDLVGTGSKTVTSVTDTNVGGK